MRGNLREEMKRRRRKRREGKNWQPCKGLRKAGMGEEEEVGEDEKQW